MKKDYVKQSYQCLVDVVVLKYYTINNVTQMLSLVPGHFRGSLYSEHSSASYLHLK